MRTKGYREIYQISQPDKPIALVRGNLRACLVSWERASLNRFTFGSQLSSFVFASLGFKIDTRDHLDCKCKVSGPSQTIDLSVLYVR